MPSFLISYHSNYKMGQGDFKLLSQQSELSRSYLIDGYQKE
jgi:hypothetical protein